MAETMKAIITAPDEIPVRAGFFTDFEDRLVSGALTEDGIQYSSEVSTGAADTDVTVLSKLINPVLEGRILLVEFGLTADFKAVSSGTADLIWKWQARNKDGTWVDLHSAVTETDIGTTYKSRTRSGYFTPEANFQDVPFEVRLILQCNELNEGRARVKNSSYVRVIYRVV